MPDFEAFREVSDCCLSRWLDLIQKISFSVEVVWNTSDLLTSAVRNTAKKQRNQAT